MNVRFPLRSLVLAAVAASFTAAAADPATIAAEKTLQPPQVQERGDVRFVTGGVGIEGRRELQTRTQGMNLELVFAQAQTGALHAKVDVSIADASGKEVLKVEDADPMLFADLAPGTYSVKASHADGSIEREVTVRAQGLHREVVSWS
jgi:hypothetical protein